MILFRLVSCLFLLPLLLIGQGQIPPFEEVIIENDDGLNSWLMIEQIHQTSDGAFWFLINEGIYRYNGVRAVNVSRYLSSNSRYRLNDQQATCFAFDKDEVLWLGRRKGLFKVNLKDNSIDKIVLDEPLRSSDHRNYILQIEEHKDTMYIGTANGLYLVDRKSGVKLKSYVNNGEVPERYRESTKSVKSIYPNIEKDVIWAVLMDGFYRFSKKGDFSERFTIPEKWADSLSHNFFRTPLIKEKIYFPSWGLGMVEFDFDTKTFARYPASEVFPQTHDYNTIRTAIPINDSLALINASRIGNGFFNRNTQQFSWLPTRDEMRQTWATHLYLDFDGFIWSAQTGKIFRSTRPVKRVIETSNPILDISAVFVNNKLERIPALTGYEGIELNEYQKRVQLEFTVTKPHLYDTITYTYQLGNSAWKPIAIENYLKLTLGAGHNPIRIRAQSENGAIIAQNQLDLSIVIPFYKTWWFLMVVALFLIVLTYLLVNYLNKKALVQKLKELDTVKSRFFNNISHEFRTPLTIMAAPLQQRLSQPGIDAKDKREFELMLKSNKQLTKLVDELLELSKLESGKAKLRVSALNISTFLRALVEPFQYQAENKGIDFKLVEEGSEDAIWCDGEALQKIGSNLLSNAVKYTPEGGYIGIKARIAKGSLYLRVENTGVILSKEERKQLFNRFYQTNHNSNGVGIGLALVKELVELHKGAIQLDGSYTAGTAFDLRLPIVKSAFRNAEIASDREFALREIDVAEEVEMTTSNEKEGANQTLLLLVEDNAALRAVLIESLKGMYNIVVAKDGIEGTNKALEQIPDLIISDVMMPKKNGVELTKELKKHELTSHIPIVLLTAKAGDENILSGVQSGADDYIVKPFNNQLLQSKIANLLAIRNTMRNRYSQEIILKPQDIAVTPQDELLLERVQRVLDTYLTTAAFSTEDFARALGFSRMQLHRKLKALTGLSATEFIRSQRLKLAAQLLEKSNANVSEVCYQTGFNNLSYFAKCFKQAYGVSPSAYSKRG